MITFNKYTTRAEREAVADEKGIEFQRQYENVIAQLAEVRLRKCIEYGERRYRVDDPEFNRWMCYSDVYRKFIRLEKQMADVDPQAPSLGIVNLLETYRDLANYAIMAVQLLEDEV